MVVWAMVMSPPEVPGGTSTEVARGWEAVGSVPELAWPPEVGSAEPVAVTGGGLSGCGVTGLEGEDGSLVPAAFVAVTVNVYVVPFVSPVMLAEVVAPSTLTLLPTGEEVTVYPVMGLPPSEAGGNHVTLAWPSPAAAVTFVGGDGVDATQVPLESHVPPPLHAAPVFGVTVQEDVPLHVRVLHSSLVQVIAVPTHWPLPSHVSLYVQALPSSHGPPGLATGLEHTPVVVSHTPATWHWSSAEHTTGLDPTQVPLPPH